MAQLKVNKISNLITLTETPASVLVQRNATQIVKVTSVGPQGPPFVGSNFFDVGAIGALSASDVGKVLKFDGTNFIPTNELETNLTINGGAF